ncbi:prepilin-type N-terminal cleavage/methylation domain-containing protein [Candidatus Saccharibacteria bacterium]|nr:prepilin-type N-terminal cleavage/methylation domain-containing protein [Candidatus Saccharibacteria bacterium]
MEAKRSYKGQAQAGYTLVELLVIITITAVLTTTFFTFFRTSLYSYLRLQTDASTLTDLETEAVRLATVMRSATDITTASADEFEGYAYFSPSDNYVSLIHYYQQTTSGITQVKADVTPMTANPPTGTPISAQQRSYTVIDNYFPTSGTDLFTYLNASGVAITQPISDLDSIKGVKISLAAKTYDKTTNQEINVQVALRNRKVNL